MNQQNTLSLQALNSLDSKESEQWFSQCCAAPKWFKGILYIYIYVCFMHADIFY